MTENWLETDYKTEGVLALEMTAEQLSKVLSDPYRWKWSIVALHHALQALLVHACSGSDLLGAMTREYQRHWHERHRQGQTPTRAPRLASIHELLGRASDLKGYVHSRPLRPTQEQASAVRRLNPWRDDFIHYKPGSLSIEVSGFPSMCRPCLDLIQFLAFESGHVFMDQGELPQRAEIALKLARNTIARIERAYSR